MGAVNTHVSDCGVHCFTYNGQNICMLFVYLGRVYCLLVCYTMPEAFYLMLGFLR